MPHFWGKHCVLVLLCICFHVEHTIVLESIKTVSDKLVMAIN